MESVFHLQELKPFLESQKDVNMLEDNGERSQRPKKSLMTEE